MTPHSLLQKSVLALILVVLLGNGCGAPPPAPPRLSTPYSIARAGYLRYRLPVGWFDVTADSQAHGNAVWLLRSDYAATITVNEIRVDATARSEVARAGLTTLARLTMFLSTQDKGALLQKPPEEFVVRGRPCCSYELLLPSSGDVLRTILFDAGEKFYAVAALRASGMSKGADVADVQMEFVEGLRW